MLIIDAGEVGGVILIGEANAVGQVELGAAVGGVVAKADGARALGEGGEAGGRVVRRRWRVCWRRWRGIESLLGIAGAQPNLPR